MTDLSFRIATRDDVPDIVGLLADDVLGQGREDQMDLAPYLAAFDAMRDDPNNENFVVVDGLGSILGCFQMTIIHGLSLGGRTRAQIEGVRISSEARGMGLGGKMIRFAIEEAGRRGATYLQLNTNLQRNDALRFYESHGFVHSHAGFKLSVA